MKKLFLLTAIFATSSFAAELTNEQYCVKKSGSIVAMQSGYTNESYMSGGKQMNFCRYNNSIIGLSTLSESANIATTYINKLDKSDMSKIMDDAKKLPDYRSFANQSSYVCTLLKGQNVSFKNESGENGLCFFSDGSSIDSWTLVYAANGDDKKVKHLMRAKNLKTQLPYLK